MDNQKVKNPEVIIGLPVFNGEKYLQKRLDSIISQTYSNYQLIISDNASTDKTQKICNDYLKKDSRFKYFRQEKNVGPWKNFQFVLQKAESKYFVWAAVDDWWLPQFLEKNVQVLDSNNRFVGSISRIEYYDSVDSKIKPPKFSKIKKYYSYDEYPKSSKFENRVKFYLRLNTAENIYSVFHSRIIKKIINVKQCAGIDSIILLGVLKFGEINMLNEVLMYRSAKGLSATSGDNKLTRFNGYGFVGRILPFLPLTLFVAKNLGIKVFFENLDYLLFMNLSALKYQIKHGFK